MNSPLVRSIHRLMPAALTDDEARRHALITVAGALLSAIGGFGAGTWHMVAGVRLIGLAYYAGSFGALLVLGLIHLTNRWRLCGHLLVGHWTAVFFFVAVLRGGLWTSPMLILAAAPVLATSTVGRRAGIGWFGVVALGACALGLAPEFGYELHDRLPPGRLTHARLMGSIIYFGFAGALALVLYDRTQSALREAEAAERERVLAATEAKVLRTERMASIGRLAAGTAHEINNPLAYVIHNLEHLQERLESAHPDLLAPVDEALDGARRIRRIVQDLRTFGREDEEEQGVADVARALEQAVRIAEPQIRHRAELERVIDDVPGVIGDENRLTQVFLNLLLNAVQAFGERTDGRIVVKVTSEDDRVVATVRDDGPGIPAELVERVAEPFFTTKPVGVGTGLGLPVSRNLVERYGGSLQLESEVGQGTTARLVLRASSEPVVQTPQRPARTRSTELVRPRRILLCDDDRLVTKAMRRILMDHEVVIVSAGEEALALIEEDQRWDLFICDVMMPGIDGVEVYERVLNRWPELADRMVFMSGGTFTPRTRKFVHETAPHFLKKPVDAEALRALALGPADVVVA